MSGNRSQIIEKKDNAEAKYLDTFIGAYMEPFNYIEPTETTTRYVQFLHK